MVVMWTFRRSLKWTKPVQKYYQEERQGEGFKTTRRFDRDKDTIREWHTPLIPAPSYPFQSFRVCIHRNKQLLEKWLGPYTKPHTYTNSTALVTWSWRMVLTVVDWGTEAPHPIIHWTRLNHSIWWLNDRNKPFWRARSIRLQMHEKLREDLLNSFLILGNTWWKTYKVLLSRNSERGPTIAASELSCYHPWIIQKSRFSGMLFT